MTATPSSSLQLGIFPQLRDIAEFLLVPCLFTVLAEPQLCLGCPGVVVYFVDSLSFDGVKCLLQIDESKAQRHPTLPLYFD